MSWEVVVIKSNVQKMEIHLHQGRFRLLGSSYIGPIAAYNQVLKIMALPDKLEILLRLCSRHVEESGLIIKDPVALLKEVAKFVRIMTRQILLPLGSSMIDLHEDMKKMPFRHIRDNSIQLVDNLLMCKEYPDMVAKLYGGIFSCHNQKPIVSYDDANNQNPKDQYTKIITDVDLLCVFVAMVSLRGGVRVNCALSQDILFGLIIKSLRSMKSIFRDQWKNWPFTRLTGGNRMRDIRTFDALCGFDLSNGRSNDWKSVTQGWIQHSQESGRESLKNYINGFSSGGDGYSSINVYAGKPVYDIFHHLPHETHELLFGEKMAYVLRHCFIYSVKNMPYFLASDTHPVIADQFPPIVPSGCTPGTNVPFLSTNNLTLISRHAIPSTRKLGNYLLERESMPLDLERSVAECMVHSSINDEQVVIFDPESEIECLNRHISQLCNQQMEERCGVYNEKLNLTLSKPQK